ncbi:MAG: TIGR00297 family protein [Xenococcaceae cyanobacterium MO_188.B29]|nr:TIGR00297 family protein [Xenococcaceae cyanobacterium MO_188.B29]
MNFSASPNYLSILQGGTSWYYPWLFAMGLNALLLSIVWIAPKKLLTPVGILNAWLLGVIVWATLGWQGYTIVVFYFIFGSAVTRVGLAEKEAMGIAEERSGARGAGNVWGSALTATICALGTLFVSEPISNLLLLGYVASFSTKLSDTTATEIGKAYGKRTFLITTLQPVPRGTEGAVSLEGTLAGIAASVAIAFLGWAVGIISFLGVIWCIIAAFVATTIESLIGATIEDKIPWLTHDLVNILNTLIGAFVAIFIAWIYQLTVIS